jgi:hypothetical protein
VLPVQVLPRNRQIATLITFFLAEMGDKTQFATVAMVAQSRTPVLVVIGTILGMLLADVPAVLVGEKLAAKIPMNLVHSVAAAIFALLGIATLLAAGATPGVRLRVVTGSKEPQATKTLFSHHLLQSAPTTCRDVGWRQFERRVHSGRPFATSA